jgi:hypothetical protein
VARDITSAIRRLIGFIVSEPRTDSITQPPSAARSWNVLRASLRNS